MFGLGEELGRSAENPLRVLGVGAHADDLEIGCGGSVLRLLAERPHTEIVWAILSGAGTAREKEARSAAEDFLPKARSTNVIVAGYMDGHFPFYGSDIKVYFEQNFKSFDPHLVFAHARNDRHQDHRFVSDLTWNTFRGKAIIAEYEIPKWDGDLGQPNTYIKLDDDVAQQKVDLLLKHFPSQHDKRWYDAEVFLGLMRIRGVEAATRYAEAFTCRKLVW
ncbi:MAG: PIG-L family deacetylase [Rubricoccaceae bacterium]|nr:PIG-L family deacetylase [Rubricoccaceae bacterium]